MSKHPLQHYGVELAAAYERKARRDAQRLLDIARFDAELSGWQAFDAGSGTPLADQAELEAEAVEHD